MKMKTILSILTVFLLSASVLPTLAYAQDGAEDMHTVDISVTATNASGDDSITDIVVSMVWNYPGTFRAIADDDGDDTVTTQEAGEYASLLSAMVLEELQEAHKSHVWDMSMAGAGGSSGGSGAMAWNITATATGVEGDATSDTTDVVVSITLSMTEQDLGLQYIDVTFGPIGDKNGTGLDTPDWPTSITVTGGTKWCPANVTSDAGVALGVAFAYHDTDEYSFTASYGQEGCDDAEKNDTDKDGVDDADDACPATPADTVVDEVGCEIPDGSDTDTDGDGVMDNTDACPDTTAGATVDATGCADDQVPEEPEDDSFNVTFTADVGDGSNATSYTCAGMTNTSTAADCMTAANFSLPGGSTDAAGHPHHWTWSLQVNGAALADQDAANLTLADATATFAWVADGCRGDCRSTTVHEVTALTGTVAADSGDCVWFNGVTPTFTDGFDNTGSYRCFDAAGDYVSGDLTITVATAASTNGTGTDPIVETEDKDEDTPGFGLVAGITAALGAALIAASRRED